MTRGTWRVGLALAVAATMPDEAGAQRLLVTTFDAVANRPLTGVFVTIAEGDGARVRGALTNERGAYLFADLDPGVYRVTAEVIGYASGVAVDVRGARGEARELRLDLTPRPLALRGLQVGGGARCEIAASQGVAVQALWSEARKALAAVSWGSETRQFEFDIERHARAIDRRTNFVEQEAFEKREGVVGKPFESLPVDDLLERGFVQGDRGGDRFYAPDADVLLSDRFLDSHCMRPRIGIEEEAGWVGLEFEPVRERRVPDITGVLWIDPTTAELIRLDFVYVNLTTEFPLEDVGGFVEFRRLESGGWIVPVWEIRMPWLERAERVRMHRPWYQRGHIVEGGRVTAIRNHGRAVAFAPAITGAVAPDADAADTTALGATAVVRPAAESVITPEPPGSRDPELEEPDEDAFEIEGLAVRVEARVARLEEVGFYERRDATIGHFIDPDEVRKPGHFDPSDLFRMVPGAFTVQSAGQFGSHVGVVLRRCRPDIWIDGRLARSGSTDSRRLDELLRLEDIAGVEVYRSPVELPGKFTSVGSRCALVIWTH